MVKIILGSKNDLCQSKWCTEFLGIKLDDGLTFSAMIEDTRAKCRSRLDLLKILSYKNWGLNSITLGSLYKSLIGSIIDYVFPCLNLLSETNLKKLQVIQNSATRTILKLRYDTPTSFLHHEAKLKLHTFANRLDELTEKYVGRSLAYSVPLVVRLVDEYKRGYNIKKCQLSNSTVQLLSCL